MSDGTAATRRRTPMAKKTSRPTNDRAAAKQNSSVGTDFNLRILVHEVAREMPYAELSQLAEATAKRVPEEHLRAALEQSVIFYVRHVRTEGRLRGPATPPVRPSRDGVAGVSSEPRPTPTTGVGGPAATYSGSRKGDEIRDAWQAVLEQPYTTPGGHKALGDCTHDDLYAMSERLDRLAEENKAKARGWRGVAGLLTEYDVETVRELPIEILMKALGGK